MNKSRNDPSNEPRDLDDMQQRRRSLLRAAASAAPLVATLPSGAAYALASTSQCIIQSRTATQGTATQSATVSPALSGSIPDGYSRVAGFQYTFRQGLLRPPRVVTVYSIGSTAAPPYYFGSSGTVGGASYTIGAVFDPLTFNSASGVWNMTSGPTAVQLLKLYRAESDTGNPYSNPTCANNCTPSATDSNGQCIFPVSQVGTPDLLGQNPGNNLGLATSCLASVYPPVSGRSCPQ